MLVALWSSVGVTPAAAQVGQVPIIEAGREDETLALFAPYTLTGEVSDGFRLMNVRIEATYIACELVGPGDDTASVRLEHPDYADDSDGETASFAVRREASSDAGRRAADAIYAAILENDPGGFHRRRAQLPPPSAARPIERLLGSGWAIDGMVLCLLGLALFLVLLGRDLAKGSRTARCGVVGLTVLGALLRLTLSPATMLGAWPFSRTTPLMRLIWEGPGLAAVLERAEAQAHYFDVAIAVDLLFAIGTPAAVFLHAKKLLDSERTALLAAVIVAVLPVHLRFSQSEVAFIPSLALSSFTFALVHIALKDESARFRLAATVALPFVAGVMFVTRPLNQIFLPLLLWTAFYLSRRSARLRSRLLVSTLLVAVAVTTFVLEVQPLYGDQIANGLTFVTVTTGIRSFFSPLQNSLLHPWITPPVLSVLAVVGAWISVRGPGPEREKGVFLVAWLLLFYVAHAYVTPRSIAMQARYHLHLVVPFVLLAALGFARMHARRRALFWAGVAYLLATPFLHSSFIRDVAFDDQREYAFVRDVAREIPESCTVLEYTGEGAGDVDLRFDRAGAILDGHTERRRFVPLSIGAEAGAPDALLEEARALLETPPPCLYYYEGLFCFARKKDDEQIAAACEAVHRGAALDEVATTRFTPRIYDGNLAGNLGDRSEPITLTLFRVFDRRR